MMMVASLPDVETPVIATPPEPPAFPALTFGDDCPTSRTPSRCESPACSSPERVDDLRQATADFWMFACGRLITKRPLPSRTPSPISSVTQSRSRSFERINNWVRQLRRARSVSSCRVRSRRSARTRRLPDRRPRLQKLCCWPPLQIFNVKKASNTPPPVARKRATADRSIKDETGREF